MDLAQFDTVTAAEAGAFMQLLHPSTGISLVDDNQKPIGITFAGADSERARRYTRKAQNRRLSLAPQRRGKVTAEEIEDEGLGLIAACALSWNVVIDGATPDCTPDNVRAFLKRFPAFREQADTFIGERANFLKDSPST